MILFSNKYKNIAASYIISYSLLLIMMSAKHLKKMRCLWCNTYCIVLNWMLIQNYIKPLLHCLPTVFSHLLFWAYITEISNPYLTWMQETSLVCYVSLCSKKKSFLEHCICRFTFNLISVTSFLKRFEFNSAVCGFHVYRNVYTAQLDENEN